MGYDDALHYRGEGFGPGDALEFLGIERIKADIDAAQASGDEPVAPFGQQVAVGGHGEVLDAEGVETSDKVLNAIANERLATGDAYFADAEAEKDRGKPVEFWPGENFVVIAIVFRVGRAAINAPEVAAIRDGDAQVGDLAAEFVVKGHGPLHLLDAVPRFLDALGL